MTYFNNITKLNDISLNFELKNVKLSLANALRRIIIADIPINSINFDDIEVLENTSMLHNFYLSKRLVLFPIKYLGNPENIIVKLNKTNNEDHMIDILSSDFEIYNDTSPISPKDFFISDEILFGKLKPGQSVQLNAKVISNIAKYNTSAFSPVSKSVLTYKVDENALNEAKGKMSIDEQEKFVKDNREFYYYKNENDEPTIFELSIESLGTIDPTDLVTKAIQILKTKLEIVAEAVEGGKGADNLGVSTFPKGADNLGVSTFPKGADEDKVDVNLSKKLFEAYDFTIYNEDDTLANFINQYLHSEPLTKYSGYLLMHPKDKKITITLALRDKNTEEENKKFFVSVVKQLMKKCDELANEWKVAMTGKTEVKPTTVVKRKLKVKK